MREILFPHQEEVLPKIEDGKILHGGVGSGKTLVAIAYYVQKHSPKDVYVITTAKKRDDLDWMREAAKYGLGTKPDATLHGILTVDSWNNIKNYTDVEDAFFIFDEQRLVGSGTWVQSFYKIAKNNPWILLSATPGDNWLDYIPVFVANGLYKNATQFKWEHVEYVPRMTFPKVKRYHNEDILEKYRNMLLVEMPYLRHTKRHLEYVKCEYDEVTYKHLTKERWNAREQRPILTAAELWHELRRVTSVSEDRWEKLLEIIKHRRKVIIFYNYDYELEMLRELKRIVPTAEWNGHRKQAIPDGDNWVYLVQYTSGAEGWNCTDTDTTVFWSLTYSWKIFEQAQGRIDRLDTPFVDLYYYIMTSDAFADKAVLAANKRKKNFNESTYIKTTALSQGWEEQDPIERKYAA